MAGYFLNKNNLSRGLFLPLSFSIFIILNVLFLFNNGSSAYGQDKAKYVILMIADGWSANDIEASRKYCQASGTCSNSNPPPYDQWAKYFMSTYTYGTGCGYNTYQAWSNFNYVKTGCITGSAAAASALYTGIKTVNPVISVSSGLNRLETIEEKARVFGMASGAISNVEASDATIGAWVAHNDDRANHFAIADEGFFGDPNTTGTPPTSGYAGSHGPTFPSADVVIGDGRLTYVNDAIKNKLRTESGQTGKHSLIERQSGHNGGADLMAAANDPNVTKLAGLFDQIYRLADGSGYNPENPTLSESSLATLTVLDGNPNGFVLMIEGGAVDWGAHAMNMNYVVGEMIDFNDAVRTVIDWIEDTNNYSDWTNTLLIVTGDHETGYLTAGPGVFANQPIGAVRGSTISKEKININNGFRASWEDTNSNNRIDTGETVYWSWNSSSHTNSLIPLYVKGVGAGLFSNYATNYDSVRGYYIDNTNVFDVINSVLGDMGEPASVITTPVNGLILNSTAPSPYTVSGTATDYVSVESVKVSTNGGGAWDAAVCDGCPGTSVTWTYNWTLPANGSYNIKSKATDTSINVETPGSGNIVTVDRTAPMVSSTVPTNGLTGVALNSSVTITWNENVDCTTVNTVNVTISPVAGWTRTSCSGSHAVFTPGGQSGSTIYTLIVTTGVTDTAGNVMNANYPFSFTTIDITAPAVTAFTATSPSKSLNIPITLFTATDNIGVTGYMITTTATPPLSGDAGWTPSAPAAYTVGVDGTYTLYPWAKDATGNVSAVFATPGSVTVDTIAPAVLSTIPADQATNVALDSNVTITFSENINCATVNTGSITSDSPGWTLINCSTNQAVFNTSGQAGSTIYNVSVTTGIKDVAGNIMAAPYSFSYTTIDYLAPVVTAFTVPAYSTNLNIPITTFTATDTLGVTGYKVTTTATPPLPEDAGWTPSAPAANTVASDGTYTLYPWAKDEVGNVSAVFATPPDVIVDTVRPEVVVIDPADDQIYVPLNSDVTITFSENINCATVNTGSITSDSPGWTLINCSTNQAVFNTSGQAELVTYTTTVTTGVLDMAGNPVFALYVFSYTTTETQAPLVTGFDISAYSTSWNIPVTTFTATDNVAVNGYKITTIAAPPLAGDPGWATSAPATYAVASDGTYTLYPWAKDTAGNVSVVFATPRSVDVDTVAPAISSTIPADKATGIIINSDVRITFSENIDCNSVTVTTVTISPVVGWTKTSCSGNIAVFTTSSQAGSTVYTVTVSAAVADANGNPMVSDYPFSYTTADVTVPTVTDFTAATPSTSLNIPITALTVTDNVGVTGYKITESAAVPLAGDAGWTGTAPAVYTVASDGTYTLYPWAKDAAGNVSEEYAGPGTVIVDTTAPAVTSTVPVNGAASVALNSSVTVNWTENVNCATVNTTNITSDSPGWELSSCSYNHAVFTTSGQSGETTYTVTVTTAVTDASGCAMEANYQFSFRTNVSTTLSIMEPDGTGDTVSSGDSYLITYTLTDPDNVATVAFYYDTDNEGLDGIAIAGACSAASEGTGVTCARDTAGMLPGEYYVYGITNVSGSGTTRLWTGGGTDTLASNVANWVDDSLPQNGDNVIFNGTSVKDCNWDMDVSIHSISLNMGYKGTVTINSTSTISLSGDSIIADGMLITENAIFYGNGQNVYSPGPITINPGL